MYPKKYFICWHNMKFTIIAFILLISPPVVGQYVKGKIVDEENVPVSGAFLIALPDSSSAVTSHNGSFSLPACDSLFIQHVGYHSRIYLVPEGSDFLRIQIAAKSRRLEEITVNALTLSTDLMSYDGNSTFIPRKKIRQSSPDIITDILNNEPGIYMHSGALNTNRITIRGVGARSPFTTNKIRAYYGEIPLTNGSGETTIEDIGLSTIGNLEVIKGPNSSTFGSGLGGVIQLQPREPDAISNSRYLNFSAGSFGFFKSTTGLSLTGSNKGLRVELSRLVSEGYRDNNELERLTGFITANFFDEKNKFSLITYLIDQKAFIPSSINETDYNDNPSKAADNWAAARGFEDYITIFTGLGWDRILSEKWMIQTSVFANYKDNYEPRPFNILDESTAGTGLRSKISLDYSSLLKAVVGVEIFYDQNRWKTLENLYQIYVGNGSFPGDVLTQFREQRGYFNFFLKNESRLFEDLKLTAGLNLNRTQYTLEDLDGNEPDQSGKYSYDWTFSPRLGINYRLNSDIAIFGSISHGFSPPTLEETLNPEGLINNNIQPETGWMQEAGFRYQGKKTSFSATAYLMQIRDLLVARRTAQDQYIGLNAGATSQNGVELDLHAILWSINNFTSTIRASYAFQHYRFETFVEDENDFSGNQLTGVPEHQLNSSLRLEYLKGFYSELSWRYIDEIPVTDDNSVYADSYQLLNLNTGYTFQVNNWEADLTYWVRNLLDENYASMVLINAVGFGGSLPRYYYPGNPRNHMVRVSIRYNLSH